MWTYRNIQSTVCDLRFKLSRSQTTVLEPVISFNGWAAVLLRCNRVSSCGLQGDGSGTNSHKIRVSASRWNWLYHISYDYLANSKHCIAWETSELLHCTKVCFSMSMRVFNSIQWLWAKSFTKHPKFPKSELKYSMKILKSKCHKCVAQFCCCRCAYHICTILDLT